MFNVPATPEDDSTSSARCRRAGRRRRPQRSRDGVATTRDARLATGSACRSRPGARDSRDVPHEDRRGVRRLPQAVLKPYIGRGPTTTARRARRGAAGARDHGPAQPRRRRRVAEPPARLRLQARQAGRRSAVREDDSVELARRAYRRPVTDADMKVLLDFYSRAAPTGTFDAGIELALQRDSRQPVVPVPDRARPGERRAGRASTASAISSSRRGCRSSSGAAFPTTSCSTSPAQGKLHEPAVLERQAQADARGSAVAGVHRQLRRPVAVAAPAAGHRSRSVPLSRLRRHAARWRFSGKPSCSSTASFARTARRSIC